MRQPIRITALGSRIALVLYALAAAACVLLVYAATARRSAQVEIVTTPVHTPVPTSTPIVAKRPQLPPVEPEVEVAGDRIAEVEVYLRKRQSAKALDALTHARNATARAIESRQRKGSRVDELASTLKGLDSVERAIQRGQLDDAHRQLVALDKNLDRLDY
jgi:hypothetical protein